MAKKEYECFELKWIILQCDDIITSSGGDSNENGFDLGDDNDFWGFKDGVMRRN